jgi:hypothetical protein
MRASICYYLLMESSVTFRVSAEAAKLYEQKARALGVTVSALCRHILDIHLGLTEEMLARAIAANARARELEAEEWRQYAEARDRYVSLKAAHETYVIAAQQSAN